MLISLEGIQFGYNDVVLLNGVDFHLSEGEKIGLIGGNGEGKTTLLKLILGELSPNAGQVFRKNGAKIGYLAQNGGFDSDKTVIEEMRSVFTAEREAIEKLRAVEKSISELPAHEGNLYEELAQTYEKLNKFIAAKDAYQYEIKIKTVLGGMGFEKDFDKVIRCMSGGEKTRLKFCRLLLERPDLLILDEPTNHLDVKTLFWLEEYLASYKGAVLMVSHDRYFLDRTVQKIADLENGVLTVYKGNYSKYKILKAERIAVQQKEYEKQQVQIAHMQEYVDRNLVRASTTKMAQSRRTALEKMERIEKPTKGAPLPRFCFTYTDSPYENVLKLDNYTLNVAERTLIRNANALIRRGEKCALVGDNGTGKSTLVKRIVEGKEDGIFLGRFVRIGYYDQENLNLHADRSVLSELWERHVCASQTEIRSVLAKVGLFAEDMDKKIRSLSGGERAKLALAVLEQEHGNFLILDEPTNHLDLPTRESLEEALKAFDGTLLFVSHDRYFIQALADKILRIDENGLTEFKGSYAEFLNADEKKTTPPAAEGVRTERKENFKSRQDRAEEARKRSRIKEIERDIAMLEAEECALNEDLTKPAITADYALLKEKCDRLEAIRQQTERLYEEYETLI